MDKGRNTAVGLNRGLTFLVVGGDCRQNFLARRLSSEGYSVYTCGLSTEQDTGASIRLTNLSEMASVPDVIVLPLTASDDGENISAPFSDKKIPLTDVAGLCGASTLVVGGRLTDGVKAIFGEKNIPTADYFNREELIIKNCLPTAEGTLMLAMENTAYTISSSRVLILGFGRVAKAVARLFSAVGARVSVAARKSSDLALASVLGYDAFSLSALCDRIGGFDVIINTAPALLLGSDALSETDSSALIIDLASKPGGVDLDTAKLLGLRVIWALSLPPNDTLCECVLWGDKRRLRRRLPRRGSLLPAVGGQALSPLRVSEQGFL